MARRPMDDVTDERRQLMGRVRGKNSAPELAARSVAHEFGYRFRLHRKDLPGSPDLVFPRLRKVIFVHGCFWHRHPGCSRTTTPKTRQEFWVEKFEANVARDLRNLQDLETLGWKCRVVWECETKDPESLRAILRAFLADQTSL